MKIPNGYSASGTVCAKCRKPVEQTEVGTNPVRATAFVCFWCHGEFLRVESPDRFSDMSWVPKVVFAPKWPGFSVYRTTTKPERRRVSP